MHELSIATNIINIVTANLTQYPGAKINSITVSVGVYSGMEPEALHFCFPLASEGTSVEGAKLHINVIPMKLTCNECGSCSEISSSMLCPVCGSLEITVESGRDLVVSSIDLTLPEEH